MSVDLTWDLESIFAGGSQSKSYLAFLDELATDIAAVDTQNLPQDETAWVHLLETLYSLSNRLMHGRAFAGCLVAQNVKDTEALQRSAQTDDLGAQLGSLWTAVNAALAQLDYETWENLLQRPELEAARFNLTEQRQIARAKLGPEMEVLINDLSTDGYHGWGRYYSISSGDYQVEFDGEALSLGQLQNKYLDAPNRDTRRRAFELFEASWDELAKTTAVALNHQAGFRLTLYRYRGWDVLKEPLFNNRLQAATLDAMWHVIDSKSEKLLDYFAAKAKLMGVEQLDWYDVAAPVGNAQPSYTFAQAADFVVDSIRPFNSDIADFCRMAVDKRWVESENRSGKRAGAFCTGLPLVSQPRIFMTYNGSYNGMLTLAHELGHGYHGWVMRDLPYSARRYTMSVAETASTFNQSVVADSAIKAAQNDDERLSMLASQLNDVATFLMNIRCRFDFERAFFAARAKGQLSVADLNSLMAEAQQTAFKHGLRSYHPTFWASKLHFYLTRSPFYNFPYTFGFLFSNGVYAQALAEGPGFTQRYIALLRDTGTMTTEDLAQTHLGVDLTQTTFWEQAVDRVLTGIDTFAELVDKQTA